MTGIREDYGFQAEGVRNVDLEVGMLDNDFEDPDINRYLELFDRFDPSIAVVGDAYSHADAVEYQEVVDELSQEHPYKTYIVAPKCREAFEVLEDSVTLGYPIGYSDLDPFDVAPLSEWRGNEIHILGGSPTKQWDAIRELTQPTLTGLPSAEVVGVDWNGPHKVAYMGEHWSRDGWQPADHLSIRETVRKSLEEIKEFWLEREFWPGTELRELNGEAVLEPDEPIYIDRGGEPISSREDLEDAVVREYEHGVYAFDSEVQADFIEYRERWLEKL
ncbi:DUF6610 family protein [Haloarcula marismortui]|uniref:DUF6610 family protein n=1 Tax=Haloarcula marismortui TaxID=2238 RepID=UPI000AD436E2